MIRILILAVCLIPQYTLAQTSLLSMLKDPKAGVAFSYYDDSWHSEAVAYYSVLTIGTEGYRVGTSTTAYIDVNFGLVGDSFKRTSLFLPLTFHVANVVSPLVRRISPKGSLKVLEIPDSLEGGPSLRYRTDKAFNQQRLMECVSLLVAYRF